MHTFVTSPRLCFIIIFQFLSMCFFLVGGALAVDVTLAWDPVMDSNLAGYKIYYRSCPAGNGCTGIGVVNDLSGQTVPLGTLTDRNAPQFIVRGLPSDSDFVFVVTAYDGSGLESGFSNEAYYLAPVADDVSDGDSIDTQSPAAPDDVSCVFHSESGGVYLAWTESTDDGTGIDRYRIYRNGDLLTEVVASNYLDTDISAGVQYSYTVTAIDGAGNESSHSIPATITIQNDIDTDQPTVGESITIDNKDGSFTLVGNWGVSTFLTGYYGSNYRFASPGSGKRQAYWTFPVEEGTYSVSARWSAYRNRAFNATYTVFNNGIELGSMTFDQRKNGGEFNLFDETYTVNAGTLDVRLTDTANGYVIADAIQIEFLGDTGGSPPADTAGNDTVIVSTDPVYIDNRDENFSTQGKWGKSSFTPGYYQKDYRYAPPGAGELSASWTFDVEDGDYALSACWSAFSNRATDATYKIYNNGTYIGSRTWNQQKDGGAFNALGTFTVQAGNLEIVLDNNANGYVIADAIMIEILN